MRQFQTWFFVSRTNNVLLSLTIATQQHIIEREADCIDVCAEMPIRERAADRDITDTIA
jgi:hypothetical protein